MTFSEFFYIDASQQVKIRFKAKFFFGHFFSLFGLFLPKNEENWQNPNCFIIFFENLLCRRFPTKKNFKKKNGFLVLAFFGLFQAYKQPKIDQKTKKYQINV